MFYEASPMVCEWKGILKGILDFEGKIGTNMCVDKRMGTKVALCTSRY